MQALEKYAGDEKVASIASLMFCQQKVDRLNNLLSPAQRLGFQLLVTCSYLSISFNRPLTLRDRHIRCLMCPRVNLGWAKNPILVELLLPMCQPTRRAGDRKNWGEQVRRNT